MMSFLILSLTAGMLALFFVGRAIEGDRQPRAIVPAWLCKLLCVGLFGMSFASLLAYLDTAHKLKELDVAGVRFLAVRDVLSVLKDAEIGQRGFLLTGRESYAAPYHAAITILPKRITAVRVAYRESGDELRVEDLLKLAELKAVEMAKTVDLKASGKTDEAMVLLESDQGRNTMDLFRISEAELARKNLDRYNQIKAELKHLAAARIWMAMSVMFGAIVQMALVAFGRKRLVAA